MPFEPGEEINLKDIIRPASKAERVGRKTFLIGGPTGHGKTFSAGTIPSEMKGLYLDFDGKSDILMTPEHDNLEIINLKFDKNNYKRHISIIAELCKVEALDDLIKEFRFIFVDGLSNFYALGAMNTHDHVSGNKFKLNYDKMDYVDDWLWKCLHRWAAYFDFLILYCHEDYLEDDTGVKRILPLCRKRLSKEIPKSFQEIYHATTSGLGDGISYSWVTRPEEHCGNTSSIMDLPNRVPNNFSLLLETDWKRVKNVDEAVKAWEKKSGGKVTRWKEGGQ